MNLQFTFRGRTRNRDGLLRAIQRIARRDGDQIGAWKDGMRLVLCPLGYLDMMEIFMAVEEEFEVEISPDDEDLLETPADFVGFVMQHTDD